MDKKNIYFYLKKIIIFFLKFNFLKKNKNKITFISFPDLSDNFGTCLIILIKTKII